MKRSTGLLALAFAVASLALPLHGGAVETWKSLPLMDGHCIGKMAADPDAHPRSCALQCSKGGYGVITADGKFLRFDEAGNEQALAALQKSDRKDHLRATVTGTLNGEVIAVSSVTID